MRKIQQSLVILVLSGIMLLVSCGKGNEKKTDNVQYFRHIQFSETPYDITKGIYPISDNDAKEINHYRFTWNEAGKLAEVAYMRGDSLLDYSDLGAARLQFTYTDSTETIHFFKKTGESKLFGSVFARIYKLDQDGKRIGMYFVDKDGNKVENRNSIAWYDWKILPDGMVQEKRYNMKGEETILNPFCPFYELRFSYDSSGYCTRMANYMGDTLYNCTAENCGDIGVSYFLFENDPKGALKNFSVFNVLHQPSNLYGGWSKFVNVLDENGYVLETSFYDQDGEYFGGKNTSIHAFVYDKHGALVEEKFFDKDRKPFMDERAKAAALKYIYDESGNPKDTLYFDASLAEIKM